MNRMIAWTIGLIASAYAGSGAAHHSLRMIEILFSVEDEFRITVPNEQAEIRSRVQTLGDLAGFIDELAAQQGKA